MPKLIALIAACLTLMGAITGTSAAAQVPSPSNGGQWGWPDTQADPDAPKTWYVMIAVEQAVGPSGCDTYRYKVSTVEPIVIQGPPEVRPAHADEISAWWMIHVRRNAPTAYRWLTTDVGHEPPEVYFRESREEAFAAFRKDGHLRKSRSCSGSMLVGLGTSRFHFEAPLDFTKTEFGEVVVPHGVTVAREMDSVAGAR